MSPLDSQITAPDAPPPDGGTPPLAEAYLRHRAWLTALLTKRYGEHDAADIAQDTWLRVQRYASPSPIRRPKALLARIAVSLAIDRGRKATRQKLLDANHGVLSTEPIASSQEQALFFEQMMLALPPKLRDVFALNHVRGLTYREIAQLRGISVKAVEKRMTQAIARCADMIRR